MSASELQKPIIAHSRNDYNSCPHQSFHRKTPAVEFFKVITNSLQLQEKLFLSVLLVIFLVGVSIGGYLLATEGHEWRSPEVYNLTSRELWEARAPVSEMAKLELPVRKVLLLHTNSSGCSNKSQCGQLMRDLQLKHMKQWGQPDVVYSFVVMPDGNVFEGRGWEFGPFFRNKTNTHMLVVAFLGKLGENVPTKSQIMTTKLFVGEAVRHGKLRKCFQIITRDVPKMIMKIAKKIENKVSFCGNVT